MNIRIDVRYILIALEDSTLGLVAGALWGLLSAMVTIVLTKLFPDVGMGRLAVITVFAAMLAAFLYIMAILVLNRYWLLGTEVIVEDLGVMMIMLMGMCLDFLMGLVSNGLLAISMVAAALLIWIERGTYALVEKVWDLKEPIRQLRNRRKMIV